MGPSPSSFSPFRYKKVRGARDFLEPYGKSHGGQFSCKKASYRFNPSWLFGPAFCFYKGFPQR